MYIVIIKQRSPDVCFALLQAPFYLKRFYFILNNSSKNGWLGVYGKCICSNFMYSFKSSP